MLAGLKIGPFWITFGTFGIFGSLLTKADIHESVLQIYGDSKRPGYYDLFCKFVAIEGGWIRCSVLQIDCSYNYGHRCCIICSLIAFTAFGRTAKIFGGGVKWVGRKLE